MRITVPDKPDESYARVAEYIKKKKKLHIVNLGEKPIKRLIEDMFALYNKTYQVLISTSMILL